MYNANEDMINSYVSDPEAWKLAEKIENLCLNCNMSGKLCGTCPIFNVNLGDNSDIRQVAKVCNVELTTEEKQECFAVSGTRNLQIA